MSDLRLTRDEAERCGLPDLLRPPSADAAHVRRVLDLVLDRVPGTEDATMRSGLTPAMRVLDVLRSYYVLLDPEDRACRDDEFRAELLAALREVGASILHNTLLGVMPPSGVAPMPVDAEAAALLARPEFGPDYKRLARGDVGREHLEGCVLAYMRAHWDELVR